MSADSLPPLYDTYDLSSPEFWNQPMRARDEAFADMRQNHPLTRHRAIVFESSGGAEQHEYWAVVRYEDIRHVSRTPQIFSSAQGITIEDNLPEIREATASFIAMDAPRHTKLRGLVSSAFTPRQIRRVEEGIKASAKQIVSEATEHKSGDFVQLVAKRLPLMTISDMIGIPAVDRERIVKAADAIVTMGDPDVVQGRDPLQAIFETVSTLYQFAIELAAERERKPGDDLMSALVHAEIDGERLTHAEIASFFILLSVAGNDTTRHTTSHAMRALTQNPDQRALLAEDVEGRMPMAVEEFLRWGSAVMDMRRTTTQPVEMHGITIPEDQKVVMFYISSNRDETVFTDPWRFDITRDPNRHQAFGGGGPHFCLGASLARTQLRSIFTEIFTQMPNIEVGELEMYEGSNFIHAVKRLPFTNA